MIKPEIGKTFKVSFDVEITKLELDENGILLVSGNVSVEKKVMGGTEICTYLVERIPFNQ
jgi:hypothetical protein